MGAASGKDGAKEILAHPWFKGLDIDLIYQRKFPLPFKPDFGNKDLSQYYNADQSKQAMKDTYIPQASKKVIKANQD